MFWITRILSRWYLFSISIEEIGVIERSNCHRVITEIPITSNDFITAVKVIESKVTGKIVLIVVIKSFVTIVNIKLPNCNIAYTVTNYIKVITPDEVRIVRNDVTSLFPSATVLVKS